MLSRQQALKSSRLSRYSVRRGPRRWEGARGLDRVAVVASGEVATGVSGTLQGASASREGGQGSEEATGGFGRFVVGRLRVGTRVHR